MWRNNPSDSDRGDNDDNDLEDDYGDDEVTRSFVMIGNWCRDDWDQQACFLSVREEMIDKKFSQCPMLSRLIL